MLLNTAAGTVKFETYQYCTYQVNANAMAITYFTRPAGP